jgi:subtilisin
VAARRALHACVVVLIALACAAIAPAAASAGRGDKPAGADAIDGRYIVVFESSVANAATETSARERALGFTARLEYRRAIEGFAARLSRAQVAELRQDPEVAFVTPDRPVHALGAVPLAAGESTPVGVRRINGAASGWTREASAAAVAIVDSGIDLSHPDLNAAQGVNCITPGAPAIDENGHGTHVAGTVGAKNTGAGVVGVAPGTKLYAVKVLDASGGGSWASVICGLDWVASNAAALDIKVANLSLGGGGMNDRSCGTTNGDALHAAICRVTRAGVLNVVAAGNDGWNLGDTPPDVPASYPEVLTVTAFGDSDGRSGGTGAAPACATDEGDDRFASFSNYATRAEDTAHMVAAPGVCVVSTWPGGGYSTLSGTSMAAPHVAGLAALCLSEGGEPGPCAGKTPAQVLAQIRADAQAASTASPAYGFAGDPLRPNAWGDYFGYAVRALDDRTAPETRLGAATQGPTRATTARFEFVAASATRFECRFDGGAWTACTSPMTYAGLPDGAHAFEVRAADVVGNVDASPAAAALVVDTVAPQTAFTGGPAGLTNSRTPAFELAATESAAFECRLDAGAWTACASPHTTPVLADGIHLVETRATDAAGNVDATPASRSFTVDATPPPARIATGPDDGTKNRTPTFEFSSEAGAALECRVDAGPWAPCASPHRPAELADGAHAFEVRARDAAGNLSTVARWAFTVDTTTLAPPTASEPIAPSVAPRDTTPPRLALALGSRKLAVVRAGGLRVAVSVSERASLSGRLVLPGATAKRLGLSRGAAVSVGRASLTPGTGKRTLVMRLSSRAKARFATVASVTLSLRIRAQDGAGNAATATRSVVLGR